MALEKPVFVSREPPCNRACPAGENIQAWLSLAQTGEIEAAWRLLTEANPLPACTGRACYHPCESHCNRTEIDAAVGIQSVEHFLGDEAIRHGWSFAPPAAETGKRVLVVGSGPAGLSAAYHLRRLGHAVEVREVDAKPGGMLRYGIPRYRLPKEPLDAEIERLRRMGIVIACSKRVGDTKTVMAAEGFDAVFVAAGASVSKRTEFPGSEAQSVLNALSLLHAVEDGERPKLGRHVVAYGGGNSALDVARTAKRLGAEDAVIVYRRNRAKMPAHDFEVGDALDEGVRIRWLSTIAGRSDGHITVERMELDAKGFPRPTGQFETLDADSIVLALGQDVDAGSLGLEAENGVLPVDEMMMTGEAGIFAGGDMIGRERTVTVAIGHGRKAARAIDAWLRKATPEEDAKTPAARFDFLNTWYYGDAVRHAPPQLTADARTTSFAEIVGTLPAQEAVAEARRCLSCGNCFGCDNCYAVCPDNAVAKTRAGQYEFRDDACKGCGLCARECPCGAIAMVPA